MSKTLYVNELKESLKDLISRYQESKLYSDNENESLALLEEIYSLQNKISQYTSESDGRKTNELY